MASERALTIRMPAPLYTRLHRQAKREDRSVAAVIRAAAGEYLDNAKRGRG